ncbi:hypothetical protein K488DRAFT_42223 [Vararia minispora EC-137]|uniref:Uncharacterized protein n=1 Tax=Vararia minispora EC-137 TaxID=1314806 RepID=A0ACB8QWV8_9AGAM|nr:hypothetical protein K488DRAFT_42223 [Vararia minispora EC-137]
MSATSGIGIAPDLSHAFSQVVSDSATRFLKISIRNESLVPDGTTPVQGSLDDDLPRLQSILDDNVPAYVIVRLDRPSSSLLLVDYVPDTAKVRDKMLYASTRSALTKHLGSSSFADTLYATSKDDLTPEAYAAHRRHVAAPKPMSAREKEMADIKAAERQAGGSAYQGSASRSSPFGTGVGLNWAPDAEEALKNLAEVSEDTILTLTIEPASEMLSVVSVSPADVEDLGSKIPSSNPSFAFFRWHQAPSGPQIGPSLVHRCPIVFIYSCPSSSPVKHRMLYSSGSSSVYQTAKSALPAGLLASRKVETSDPSELSSSFLAAELGASNESSRTGTPASAGGFSKPRGPTRRPR